MFKGWIIVSIALVLFIQVQPIQGGVFCVGDACKKSVVQRPNLDVLGAYCVRICYGPESDIYKDVCDCDKIVTTPPPPCTTTVFERALCLWSNRTCNGSRFCDWRKEKSVDMVQRQKIVCGCDLVDSNVKDPCTWSPRAVVMCNMLKENMLLFSDFQCTCARNVPTVPPSETNVCEYTKHRDAQLTPSRRKRLFAGKDAYSCNYPGVVGLFTVIGSERKSICTATLLNRTKILFDQQCKNAMIGSIEALVDVYDIRVVNDHSNGVDLGSILPLDNTTISNRLYTASLKEPVTYNDLCVQPACLVNVRIPVYHIDLDDCRVLGYGDVADEHNTTGYQAAKLQEIRVKVNPTSITSDLLAVIRNDGIENTACTNDFSAPLVCPHKATKEWITIGVHQQAGEMCSGKGLPKQFQVANLLSESQGNGYYKAIKEYQPKPANQIPL